MRVGEIYDKKAEIWQEAYEIGYREGKEDVVIRHGKWIQLHSIDHGGIKLSTARCSNCDGHVAQLVYGEVDYKICPHCGLRMDGDSE